MSYQVLARKWRPRTFHELVGQEHVSRALVNALDQGRLHHAYLFTGTRGVGKTTLARILARCLNCESGVTSRPCGVCDSCRAIEEGRFVDLIEVDAASRTRVEDTRELLDNVQYAPTQGRYKVYLIDEVHMLSTHSFNALLKTLEEPPPHVRFLLATTDPQKLPVTVLSRCLQFALKRMTPERIVEHLGYILGEERTAFDQGALWLLGRAADGSMRDAMSLTDQAIAFGHGEVREHDVIAMLGTLDHRRILKLAESLARGDAADVLEEIAALAEQGPDFAGVLDALTAVFHRLAIAQMVPGALDNAQGDREAVIDLAARFSAEDVQLYYQIALGGRADMESAPERRTALEMTLLRMLAFRPQRAPSPAPTELPIRGAQRTSSGAGDRGAGAAGSDETSASLESPPTEPLPAEVPPATAVHTPETEMSPPWQSPSEGSASVESGTGESGTFESASLEGASLAREAGATLTEAVTQAGRGDEKSGATVPDEVLAVTPDSRPRLDSAQAFDMPEPPAERAAPNEAFEAYANTAPGECYSEWEMADMVADGEPTEGPTFDAPAAQHGAPAEVVEPGTMDNARWLEVFDRLSLSGMTANLVANCVVERDNGRALTLRLAPTQSAMNAEVHRERLERALGEVGAARQVTIEVGEIDPAMETPTVRRERLQLERRRRAVEALRDDPHIQSLEQAFGAQLLERSVTSFERDATSRGD